jgi:glycosyltransferase involved in cell wall biosynthesis
LPNNVRVNYIGIVRPHEVLATFSKYDLFFFPTSGENYGHVIAESLMAGTPVLISNKTPWQALQRDGLGWDVQLESTDAFVEIIEYLNSERIVVRGQMRNTIRKTIKMKLLTPSTLEANKRLFRISNNNNDDRLR